MKSEHGTPQSGTLPLTHAYEAARWYMVLKDPRTTFRRLRGWKSWESTEGNQETLRELEQLCADMDEVPGLPAMPSAEEIAADRYRGQTSVAAWNSSHRRQHRERKRRLVAPLGLAAAITIAVGCVLLIADRGLSPGEHVFRTGVAENRDVRLPDGSRIRLGAKSVVTSNITATQRVVVLDQGEALFTVQHDARRPFRVLAGSGVITAVGTAFVVRHQADDIIVSVTEGTVEVASNNTSSPGREHGALGRAVLRVTRGEEVSYNIAGLVSMPKLADIGTPEELIDGPLKYVGVPLRQVVDDANRYAQRPIVIADAVVGDLQYTGTFIGRDVQEWIANLERIYPGVEIVSSEREIMLRRRLLAVE